MGNQNNTPNGASRSEDRRQRDNQNPDRPPVDPTEPDTPDPFDPFETAHLADGGAIIQDQTELTFETHLDAALPTPETPTIGDQDTSRGPGITTENTPVSSTKPEGKPQPDNESFDRTPPVAGTLIGDIRDTITTLSPDWSYVIQPASSGPGVEHHAVTDGDAEFSIREIHGEYFVYHSSGQPRFRDANDPNQYKSFGVAMAAFIEGVDWGTLPPGNDDPKIWTYTGYEGHSNSFQAYLAGKNNVECGDHYFGNTAANYGIHIESYADQRPSAAPGETMAIVTITDNAVHGEGVPVYRGRFPGQKPAFDLLLTALADGLSNEIAMHDEDRGVLDRVPPIRILTTDP